MSRLQHFASSRTSREFCKVLAIQLLWILVDKSLRRPNLKAEKKNVFHFVLAPDWRLIQFCSSEKHAADSNWHKADFKVTANEE